MSIDAIRRIGAAAPGRGVERVGPLAPLERVERDDRREEEDGPPKRRAKPPRPRHEAADGHIDVEA